jgi:hypothetical protein
VLWWNAWSVRRRRSFYIRWNKVEVVKLNAKNGGEAGTLERRVLGEEDGLNE